MNPTNDTTSSGWHLDKRFTAGHVMTTLVVGISALMYVTTVEKRVTLLEVSDQTYQARFERFSTTINRQFDKLSEHLVRIETKLDRKQDRP